MFVEGAGRKNYMCGLMHRLAIFLRKNGLCAKEKIGNHIGKIKKQNWYISLGRTIFFSLRDFSSDVESRRSYILPDNVPANEFLNLEGNKLSTSKNWAVWLHEYLEEFPNQQDVLRYALTSNAPETKDNDFTWKDFRREIIMNWLRFMEFH
jgi:leucyl-tRNA synthetase